MRWLGYKFRLRNFQESEGGDDAHRERDEHSGGCDRNLFLAGAAERFQINLESDEEEEEEEEEKEAEVC
ncbi:hypothetical protein F2Q69_00059252 [Brassica cretica]|uniref:Uncharacterized protein n=1 Tax=Brassica cretica TaxID=69181 RepID=A0A8S9RDK6_BRACR|nr:hypothetical protein F2Q69_00059252 [Brassica cretica]